MEIEVINERGKELKDIEAGNVILLRGEYYLKIENEGGTKLDHFLNLDNYEIVSVQNMDQDEFIELEIKKLILERFV